MKQTWSMSEFSCLSEYTRLYPMFLYKARLSLKLKKALTIMKRLKDYIRSQIQKHRETFDQDDIRDFVDLYLRSHETSGNKHITGTYEEHKTFFPVL